MRNDATGGAAVGVQFWPRLRARTATAPPTAPARGNAGRTASAHRHNAKLASHARPRANAPRASASTASAATVLATAPRSSATCPARWASAARSRRRFPRSRGRRSRSRCWRWSRSAPFAGAVKGGSERLGVERGACPCRSTRSTACDPPPTSRGHTSCAPVALSIAAVRLATAARPRSRSRSVRTTVQG